MNTPEPHTANNLVDHLFRTESGKMTAILTRIFGFQNSELIEDIVQDTFLTALKTWPMKGQPDNPPAWLMQTAKNKAVNAIKRKNRLTVWNPELTQEIDKIDKLFLDHEIMDSQLRMLFTCCYPELPKKSQIMLMLKTLSGFSNAEIASTLLMSSAAVKKALYRSKKIIQTIYDDISAPVVQEAKERMDTVYTGIYLMFSEGYKRSYDDEIISEELCLESVRLVSLLLDIPGINHGKTHALLSLIYFSIARFPARKGNSGEMIDLKMQDRSLWNKRCISAGFHHLQLSRESVKLSKYHLESSIAAIHCSAASYEETDWHSILSCYRKLLQIEDTDVTRLNFAIALSKVEGPKTGLEALGRINFHPPNDKEYMLFAAKAEMNAEMGNYEMAKSYYQVAFDTAHSNADKHFLQTKIEECNRKNISRN